MPIYVALVHFKTLTGVFDVVKDTQKLNSVLHMLQMKGAKILDIKATAFPKGEHRASAIYVIIYEAEKPLYP